MEGERRKGKWKFETLIWRWEKKAIFLCYAVICGVSGHEEFCLDKLNRIK